jgi:hypothetical protein
MSPIRTLSIAAVGLAVFAAGCGSSGSSSTSTSASKPANPNGREASPPGDIPDNQAYVAYSPPGGGFSVKVPEGWARTQSGGTTTFTDKLNTIQMEPVAGPCPTVASAKAKQPAGGKVTQVNRKAGSAILVTYVGDSKPNAVTGKVHSNDVQRYIFCKGGKQVVLTLSGPKGADNVDPWKIVTDSVRFTG